MTPEEKREKVSEFSLTQAVKYRTTRDFGRSFPHFLVYAQLKPQPFKDTHLEDFLSVVYAFSEELEKSGKPEKVLQVYEQAVNVLPENCHLLTNYGSTLYKQGKLIDAERILRQVLNIDPDFLLAKDRLENMAATLLDRWHFPMLNDRDRNSKYRRAIHNKIQGGCKTVLDIGTGTGLLSLYAAEAGASRVYACEASEVMAITAADVFRLNPGGNVIKLLPKLSTDLTHEDIPEHVQLLVTETFDAGLLGEHVLQSLQHAWSNLLIHPSSPVSGIPNPTFSSSRTIPAGADFYICGLESKYIRNQTKYAKDRYGYLDTQNLDIRSHLLSQNPREPYTSESLSSIPGGYKLLTKPNLLFSIDFNNKTEVDELSLVGRVSAVDLPVSENGDLDALVGWFTLHLDENERINTEPGSETCWQQAIFPLNLMHNKVYKTESVISTEFKIHNHVELNNCKISTKQNGLLNPLNGSLSLLNGFPTNSESNGLSSNGPTLSSNGCAVSSNGHFTTSNGRLTSSNGHLTSSNGHIESSNGKLEIRIPKDLLYLPESELKRINCSKLEEVYQWVAYYAIREVCCESILDYTWMIPLLSLQITKSIPTSRLNLVVNTDEREKGRVILDFVSSTVKSNNIDISRISCITGLEGGGEDKYNIAVVSPVLQSGRLDQSLLQSLDIVLGSLVPGSGIILPHKLQLWCQIVESEELCNYSHLRSNEPVSGFKIADQINILAVTHLQDIQFKTIKRKDLSAAIEVRSIDLNVFNLS
ncbi:protein arginine N-methyltransferase 9 isoform X2 [Eurytemora carolleeae]|uniref:protein arginine N-methyltransferase 9 isoform X2 n=1 Tax=Eurytemora carolleeae TaxID=1294199 RepID=UPI000C762AA4|nr:protein arginine N-methyltransferase 9 isoform X2 [Eurytemora carolleeae]|eukprot:XP_023335504.1 protein arginine N-methyltransferase 9-like isoform X2 [Eurytemora affinis]